MLVIQKEMFNFNISFSVVLLFLALLMTFKLSKNNKIYYFTSKAKVILVYVVSNRKVPFACI